MLFRSVLLEASSVCLPASASSCFAVGLRSIVNALVLPLPSSTRVTISPSVAPLTTIVVLSFVFFFQAEDGIRDSGQ